MDLKKTLKHLSDVKYELLSQDGSTFQTHRNHILLYYPKEPVIFLYLRQNHSTPSLINNPDTDSYQDTFSQFSPLPDQSSSDLFQTQTSTKDVPHNSTPKCQNLSHPPSLNDNLDNTFDSPDSDFEMLPNPISNHLFKQTHPKTLFLNYTFILPTPPILRYPSK